MDRPLCLERVVRYRSKHRVFSSTPALARWLGELALLHCDSCAGAWHRAERASTGCGPLQLSRVLELAVIGRRRFADFLALARCGADCNTRDHSSEFICDCGNSAAGCSYLAANLRVAQFRIAMDLCVGNRPEIDGCPF